MSASLLSAAISDLPSPRRSALTRPELLAPAGDWECARAAVANGANAIYFGLPQFNARMRAENFTAEDLPKLIDFLHLHGVRGYVVMNVLVFTDEMDDIAKQLRLVAAAGADAIIVQDLGVAWLAGQIVPELAVHASTQMTLTSPEGVAFAHSRLGVRRVVLARELSLRELAKFRTGPDVPLEVFVHGALCVAYSGQCLTSEALGQRSANRGECAQACRMPYEMIVDERVHDLGDRRYLLSPQDLAAVAEIPDLIRVGVTSFKIEGRLKSPEYVAAVCQVYRRAIDAAWTALAEGDPHHPDPRAPDAPLRDHPLENPVTPGEPARPEKNDDPKPDVPPVREPARAPQPAQAPHVAPGGLTSLASQADAERYQLEMVFSRGLFSGWMHGVDHQQLVHARFGKRRGPLVGHVQAVGPEHVEIAELECPLAPGDGVVFDTGGDTNDEQGGRVYEIRGRRLYFQHGRIDFRRIGPGDRVWKTDDPKLNKALRQSFAGELAAPDLALTMRVEGHADASMKLLARRVADGREFTGESAMPLQTARQRPLTDESLSAQLGRLGGTGYALKSLENALRGEVILPVSELNRLRRSMADYFQANPVRKVQVTGAETGRVPTRRAANWREGLATLSDNILPRDASQSDVGLIVLARTPEQIAVALDEGVRTIYADFEDLRRYKDAVAQVRASGPDARIYLATPRIQKAGEQGFFTLIENAGPDGVLLRNIGALEHFAATPLDRIGDFSLNIANPLTAALLKREGLNRLTVSYDLTAPQVLSLVGAAPAEWFEITLHQHMPMFHMEHCVFAAFLSKGTDHTNCGRPCDTHQVELRDRVGLRHPVKADVGCRNTVFHGRAQSGASYVQAFRAAGVRAFRLELLLEGATETQRLIRGYRALFNGEVESAELLRTLQAESRLGVTSGTLAEKV